MSVRDVVRSNADRYLGWLREACSIPSLADRPDDLAATAAWVEDKLGSLGAETRRLTYEGAPDALLCEIGEGERRILVYDHYDVQPVDPVELWTSDPFSPEIRDGAIYARGVADNKGDLVARIAALEVYQEVRGALPVRLKFLVEGEEETGSGSFEQIVTRYADDLHAEGCIWEGAGVDHAGRPEVVFGAKGLAYVELVHRGLKDDQHSSRAVIAPSPVWHMIEALATLRAPDGKVLIDGFYDDVRAPGEREMALLEALPFDERAELERLGVDSFVGGDTGLELKRRYYFEPTCNIAGIVAGYTVPGASKTVLPKEALAKIDMRLVPDQDPHDVVAKLRTHLQARGYGDIAVNLLGAEHPVMSSPDSAIGRAALAACDGVFEQAPAVAPMMIGTGPMYPIAHTVGMPVVSPAGVTHPASNIHAPNENCRVEDYLRVIEYTVGWIDAFAATEA